MDTTTREESFRPLGVIGCLAAGFDLVGRHLGLITLPVLLDLLLWLGPRLSVAPFFNLFTALLQAQPPPSAVTTGQVTEVIQALKQLGERFNLFSFLSSLPLLNLPSLLAHHFPEIISPLGEPRLLAVTSVLAALVWIALLLPTGLALGFLYLNGLANRVRETRSPAPKTGSSATQRDQEPEQNAGTKGGMWKFVRVILFAAGLFIAGLVLVPPLLLLSGLVEMITPGMGSWLMVFGVGLLGYMGLQLLFVIPGVMVGERGLLRATWESVGLMHTQMFSVIGLVMLMAIIYGGLTFIWLLPPTDSWTLLIGIVGNSCIATGLTAATFVFYQERVGQLVETRRAA